MEVMPVGLVAVALWCAFAWRGLDWAFAYTICLMPFGMAAAFNLPALGSLSLLVFQVCAALTVGLSLLRRLEGENPFSLKGVPLTALVLMALTAYGIFSALFYPRLFQGEFDVFSMSRALRGTGERVGRFGSQVVPLQPTAANLSQTLYFILSASFFIAATSIMNRRGGALLAHRALTIAAYINGALGLLDFARLSVVLSPIRTANYSLLDEHYVSGIKRVIGGFPEASTFGAASIFILAYFVVHYLRTGERPSAIAAIVSAACAVASLSSTAYVGLALISAYVVSHMTFRMIGGAMKWESVTIFVLSVYATASLFALLMFTTPLGGLVEGIIDRLILNKQSSASGIERGAWADYGYQAFMHTFGLGAGMGSLRSSGLLPVYLGSVGIPGTLLLVTFIYLAIGRPFRPSPSSESDHQRAAIFYAGRAGSLATLVVMMLSGTIPDLGLTFMLFAAMSELARDSATRRIEPGAAIPSSLVRSIPKARA